MPRGVPNKPRTPTLDAPAISLDPPNQYTGQADAPKVVRSREEQEAADYAADFLKNNRLDLVGIEKKLPMCPEKPGWVRRHVLDQGSRVQNLLARGWRFVKRDEAVVSDSIGRGNTDLGDQVSIVTTAGGGPVRQVLMEIPQQLYDIYTEARTAPARATVDAITAGAFDVKDREHVYTPGEMPRSALFGTRNRIESKPA